MGGPIVRIGSTPEFSAAWDKIFGDGDAKSAQKTPAKKAKKATTKKSTAKKAAKPAKKKGKKK